MRTTFIVGFPQEDETDFNELINFIKDSKIENIGAFKYSPEEGTTASSLPGQVSQHIKEERINALMLLAAENSKINLKKYKDCDHLDIEIRFIEYGKDHWNLLTFQHLQPTDGFKYHLTVADDLFIHECSTFVYGAKIYIDRDNDKKEISLSCNEWSNEGTGVAMIISTSDNTCGTEKFEPEVLNVGESS